MKKSFVTSLVASLVLVGLAGCNANQVKPGPEGGDEKTLSSIAVTANPTKATYEVGENFASAGLVVTATYSDQSQEAVTGYTLNPAEGYTFVEADMPSKEFTVTYQEKTAKFTVTVNAATPVATGIRVTSEPTDKDYKVGEALNTEGLAVELVMSDGNNQGLNEFEVDPANGYVFVEEDVGQKTITVNAQGFSTSFAVTVAEADPVQTGIAVEIREGVVYYVGDEFNKESLKVEAVFDKGDNQELTADQFTVSLADAYIFQEEDMAEGVNVVVESGTFSEQINLPVIERTWDLKVAKFLNDYYELLPYDETGAGDYDLDTVLGFYFGSQQQYGYTADPDYDFAIKGTEGEEYAHLSYHAEDETDEVDAAFFGYLGLVDFPSYNAVYQDGNFYQFDWVAINWDVSGIVNFMFDASMVLYSRPNENGQYVCLEFYLDAGTTIDFDIYVSVYEAYSAAEIDEGLPEMLAELGLADTPLFAEGKSAADLSDWFYVDVDFDDEDNLEEIRLYTPIYSAQEANEDLLKDAFEEAIDEDNWEIDNSVAAIFGNFARSNSFDGKQVVVNYQQYSDIYDASNSSWYRTYPAEFFYNYYEFAIYVDSEVITFNEFATNANAEFATLGFTVELPTLNRVNGQYQYDETEHSALFVALEPEAAESYQQRLVAALQPEEGQEAAWDIFELNGANVALSVEASAGQLIQLQFKSDITSHTFVLTVNLISEPAVWNEEAVADLAAPFTGLVVPHLDGDEWLYEADDESVVIYIFGDKAEGAEQTYLEQYVALFDSASEDWEVAKELDGENLVEFTARSIVTAKLNAGMDTEYRFTAHAYVNEAGQFTVEFGFEIVYVDGIATINTLMQSLDWEYAVPEVEGLDWYVLFNENEDGSYYYDIISETTDWGTVYAAYVLMLNGDKEQSITGMFGQFGGGYQGSTAGAILDYYFTAGMNQLKIEFVLYTEDGKPYSDAQIRIFIEVESMYTKFPSAFVNDYLEYLGYTQRIGDVVSDELFTGQSGWQTDEGGKYFYEIDAMTEVADEDALNALLAALDTAFNVEGLIKDDSAAADGMIVYASEDGAVSITVMYQDLEVLVSVVMYDTEEA